MAPQLVAETPWQAGVSLGLLLLGVGGAQLVDQRRRRLLEIRRRAHARKGYLDMSARP